MINIKIDEKIRPKKIEELIDIPVVITVNDFNEEGVKEFYKKVGQAVQSPQPVIPIFIDSYGGEIHSLLAMIDILKEVDKPVATICTGKAMSCGVILFSCGSPGYRYASPNATFMIHDGTSGFIGKNQEFQAKAEELDRLNNIIYTLMSKNCGKKGDYFKKLIRNKGHADWYLGVNEAKKHNLVNKIGIPSFHVEVKLNINFK